jgi:integrase
MKKLTSSASSAIRPVVGSAAGPAQLYIASLSTPKSRQTAVDALIRIVRLLKAHDWRTFPWHRLEARETTLIRAALMRHFAASTARLDLAILKGVLKQAFRLELMSAETYTRAVMLPPIKGRSAPAGRMLSEEEIKTLSTYTSSIAAPWGPMVAALFAVGLGGGLRREELAVLRADALSDDGVHLLVAGKGGRQRVQALPVWVGQSITRWLAIRRTLGLRSDTMFVQRAGGFTPRGTLADRPLDPMGIWRIVIEIRDKAGLTRFTTHDLRRTFASRMFDRTDIANVQRLMGHANVTTTVRYDRRPEKAAETAVAGLEGWGFGGLSPKSVYVRRGKPVDPAWARRQIEALVRRKVPMGDIGRALKRIGVVRLDGRPIYAADVEILRGI